MGYEAQRYSEVPWLTTHGDLRAGLSCRSSVEWGDTHVSAWTVQHPFGKSDACMVIRATKGNGNDGGVITLALTDRAEIDTSEQPVRVVNMQSNPMRQADGDWPEDGA